MAGTISYSNLDNLKKIENYLKTPKTLIQIKKEFNLNYNQAKTFLTVATFRLKIYELEKNGKTLYAIMEDK